MTRPAQKLTRREQADACAVPADNLGAMPTRIVDPATRRDGIGTAQSVSASVSTPARWLESPPSRRDMGGSGVEALRRSGLRAMTAVMLGVGGAASVAALALADPASAHVTIVTATAHTVSAHTATARTAEARTAAAQTADVPARPLASTPSDAGPSSPTADTATAVATSGTTQPPTASTLDPIQVPTGVPPTQASATAAASRSSAVKRSPSPRPKATPTARTTVTPSARATPRSSSVRRTYAPVATPRAYSTFGTSSGTGGTSGGTNGGGSASVYPFTGAAGDLPSGAAATGAPLTRATVKAATSANPVYGSAATGSTVTKRKYIDVSGYSVNGVLGDAAIAGGVLALLGGFGLWFTRGAR